MSNIDENEVLNTELSQENPDDSGEEEEKITFTQCVFEWTQAGVVAIVAVVLILTFVFRMVNVKGDSMMNTLLDNDKVIITNLLYKPEVGDIVVISHTEKYNEPIIKRIIATEGQTVFIDFGSGEVYVDGIMLNEPYTSGPTNLKGDIEFPVTVEEGHVFVLGDNRGKSLDSRYSSIGMVDVNDIIGKAQAIVSPFYRFSLLT